LAKERRREAIAGLRCLCLSPTCSVALAFPDSAVELHSATLRRALRDLLRPSDVAFVTRARDGHADHDAAARAARSTCRALRLPLWEVPVWTWHWSRPGDPRVPWKRAVLLPLSAQAQRRKRAALREHRTQRRADATTGRPPVLSRAVLAHFDRPFEFFFATP
jgi:LmbE family N-acetylglucosaminyl deacetylase